MSDFAVQPAALKELADLLDRAKEDVEAGRSHLQPLQELTQCEGALNEGVHTSTFQGLDGWLNDLAGKVVAPAAQTVRDAAAYYERTDEESARTFDETEFPDDTYVTDTREQTGYVPIEPPEDTGRFQDVVEPQEYLRPVDKADYIREDMTSIAWYEAFSISAWTNEVITQASEFVVWIGLLDKPFNPLDELWKPYIGDWAGVGASSAALEHLAHALRVLSSNINWASQGCEEVWQGNAGDGATVHLMNMARPPYNLVVPLLDLSKAYKAAADEMVGHRDACVNLYKTLIDTAVELAAAGSVAGGSAATGVGAPVGVLAGLYAGYKAYKLIDGIKTLVGYVNYFYTALSVLEAAQSDFGAIEGGVKLPVLPTYGLDAPK